MDNIAGTTIEFPVYVRDTDNALVAAVIDTATTRIEGLPAYAPTYLEKKAGVYVVTFASIPATTEGEVYTVYINGTIAGVAWEEWTMSIIIKENMTDVKAVTDALTASSAAKLALSAGQIISGTVDTITNTHTPTTIEFQADDITEATTDHYNGRIVIFTSGSLSGQATNITAYQLVGGIGQFTVTALTEAPSNNDTFIII